MDNSPTEGSPVVAASQEPTAEATVDTTSAEQSQETISQPEVAEQEAVSEVSTADNINEEPAGEVNQQTQTQKVEAQTDDGLAKFAKSQGFDPENLTDGERRALKIAHDNQKFARSQKVAESKASVDGDITLDEITAFKQEFRQYQAQKQAEQFFAQEGRDDSLAPVMSQILEEKKAAYGPDYARVLSQDLNLLYDLARVQQGAAAPTVDADAIRREERESINHKIAAGTVGGDAVQTVAKGGAVVDEQWFATTYDPYNPEHVKLRDEYFA